MNFLKKEIEILFSSSRFRIAKQILFLALSFSIVGCDSSSATPLSVQNPQISVTHEVINDETPVQVINEIQKSGIEIGFFGNELSGSIIEMLFTYPEKYGEFGSEQFLNVSESEIISIIAQQRRVEITLEIFKDTSRDTITEILSGSLDMKIRNYFLMLAKYPNIIVRPMHEMDTVQTRYPWSGQDPQKFIAAWKHLYEINKSLNSNTQFLWSPSGEKNAMEYFPGEEYVDFVGFSLYNYPSDIETAWYGAPRDPAAEFVRKMEMMPKGIPIIIPEIGISSDSPSNKADLLSKLFQVIKTKYFGRIKSIIFFNSKETLKGYEGVNFELGQ